MYDDFELLRMFDEKKFFQRLAERYQIDTKLLMALDRDFELVERGRYSPSDEDPFPGSMQEVSSEVGLPTRKIWELRQSGAIQTPITYADLNFLRRFRLTVAGDKETMNPTDQQPRTQQTHPELNAPWKRYIYKCYVNNEIYYDSNGHMLSPEKRIFVRALAKKIASKFNLKDGPELWATIRKIREIAQNRKRY